MTEPKVQHKTDVEASPEASQSEVDVAAGTAKSGGPAATSPEAGDAAAGVQAVPPEGSPAPPEAPALSDDTYQVALPTFEGPLDLLLHLIQQHELDILDIPVSFITAKYLLYIDMMRVLSIDVASEYLVMAATLTLIKSKMLLPATPGEDGEDGIAEEEADPRAELVRRLLAYQKYKLAALDLGDRGTLGRDVFPRGMNEEQPDGPAPFAPTGVFSLFEAFERVLKRTKVQIEHQVMFDRISINDRIVELTDLLRVRRRMEFEELFSSETSRFDVVITFLSLLEMCKLKILRVYQSEPMAPMHLELAMSVDDEEAASADLFAESESDDESESETDTDSEPETDTESEIDDDD